MDAVAPLAPHFGLFLKTNAVFVVSGTEGLTRDFGAILEVDFEAASISIHFNNRMRLFSCCRVFERQLIRHLEAHKLDRAHVYFSLMQCSRLQDTDRFRGRIELQ